MGVVQLEVVLQGGGLRGAGGVARAGASAALDLGPLLEEVALEAAGEEEQSGGKGGNADRDPGEVKDDGVPGSFLRFLVNPGDSLGDCEAALWHALLVLELVPLADVLLRHHLVDGELVL